MKNTMKKLVVMLTAMVMVLGMATSAFAYTIELKNNTTEGATNGVVTNHEYTVYQLFTGDLAVVDGANVLSNIKYGSAGLGTEGAVVPDSVLEGINNAEAYAQSIMADTTLTLAAYGTLSSTNSWKLTDAPAGYYLIVDNTEKTLTKGDSYSKYIVQVVDDVTMAPKSETVTSDKKEYNDAVEKTNVNEAGVGAVVSYELTAKIPVNAAAYDTYYFILGDKLSAGLTFNDDIKVTIGGAEATLDTDYYVYYNEDGYTFEVALANAKANAGKEVVVMYSATVNDAAVTTNPEKNTFEVIYSNNPYEDYDGYKDEEGYKPGKPVFDEDDAFGKTPLKETKTYTCEIDLTKRANTEDGELLAGAVFQLTSTNANQTVVDTHEYFELSATGTYYLLKDGTYTTAAPTEDGYEEIGTGDESTTEGFILVDGEYVVPEDKADYAGKTLYKFVTGSSSKYESLTNKYEKKTATSTASVSAPVDITLTTDANGVIKFEDLGTGTYTLHEIQAPAGFNLAPDQTITITFDAENEKFEVSGTALTDGIYPVTVIDESGSTLPETGGIGTTIFYVAGAILALGAGVVLVAKRRMAR